MAYSRWPEAICGMEKGSAVLRFAVHRARDSNCECMFQFKGRDYHHAYLPEGCAGFHSHRSDSSYEYHGGLGRNGGRIRRAEPSCLY